MLRVNETVSNQDLARALDGEEGTFLAQRCGQSYLVTAQSGHSIKSFRPIGLPEPVNMPIGSNPAFNVTKLSDNIWQSEYSPSGDQLAGSSRR